MNRLLKAGEYYNKYSDQSAPPAGEPIVMRWKVLEGKESPIMKQPGIWPLEKWKVAVRPPKDHFDSDPENFGFHVFVTEAAAEAYVQNLLYIRGGNLRVVRVECAGLVAKGRNYIDSFASSYPKEPVVETYRWARRVYRINKEEK